MRDSKFKFKKDRKQRNGSMPASPRSVGVDATAQFSNEKRKVRAAFDLFDRNSRGLIVKEEIGAILRYLGAFPSDEQLLNEILPQIQDDEDVAHVKYEKFERLMVRVMVDHEYEPESEETLLQAFRTLDPQNLGYIPEEIMLQLLTGNDWPFRDNEIEDFVGFAKDPQTGLINYHEYVSKLMQSIS